MDLGQVFNKNELPESTGFDPIPAGDYRAKIAEATVKQTKDGTGNYINIRYDIIGPTHEGRVVFDMVTVKNKSQKAEEIGRQNIGSIMGALGLQSLKDTDQLVGGVCEIKVKIEKDEEYGDKNRVVRWRAIEGAQLPKQPSQSTSSMPGTQTESKPPWA